MNMNDDKLRELSDEELDEVAGGGLKEIVAGVTLAAMTVTGSPMSAFGLAKAMAEDNGFRIEQAPEQEAYGADYQAPMDEEIDVTAGDVEESAGEVSFELGGEPDPEPQPALIAKAAPEEADAPEAAYDGIDMEALKQAARAALTAQLDEGLDVATGKVYEALQDQAPEDAITLALRQVLAEMDEAGEAPEFYQPDVESDNAEDEDPEVSVYLSEEGVSEAPDADPTAGIDMDALCEKVRKSLKAHLDEGLDVATGKVYDDLLSEAPEKAITEALKRVLAEMDAAGEAPEFYQPIEENAANALTEVINDAIEARRDEGLYGTLDCVFMSLAENAPALTDPETGAIGADGSAIVNATFDALASNFDYTPEQLMGAIGAAAYRADQRGEIQLLGDDPTLVSMAAASDAQYNADALKYAKSYFDGTMNAIAIAFPGFKPFVPLLTTLSGDIFSTGGNPNAAVLNKLDDIERQLQAAEDSIRRNTYDVVILQAMGNKYSEVASKAEHAQERIGNIVGNSTLSDAQKLQRLADLMDESEFQALESAMDGATNCFTSSVNDIFERQSIFDAAYSKACSTVMFSGEAIDISMPYIVRQFAVYSAAYGVMNQVYNAYEQVYGAGSLTATRQKQAQRMGGADLNGNRIGGAIADQIKAYLGRDRYTLVDKGTASVKLDRYIYTRVMQNGQEFNPHPDIEKRMKELPLNKGQTEDLARYAAARNRSLFDYLFNEMGFIPASDYGQNIRYYQAVIAGQGYYKMAIKANPKLKADCERKLANALRSPFNQSNGRYTSSYNPVWMFTGAQSFSMKYFYVYDAGHACASVINTVDVGAGNRDNIYFFDVMIGTKTTTWQYCQPGTQVLMFFTAP